MRLMRAGADRDTGTCLQRGLTRMMDAASTSTELEAQVDNRSCSLVTEMAALDAASFTSVTRFGRVLIVEVRPRTCVWFHVGDDEFVSSPILDKLTENGGPGGHVYPGGCAALSAKLTTAWAAHSPGQPFLAPLLADVFDEMERARDL